LVNGDAGYVSLNFHRAGYTSNNIYYNGNFYVDAFFESSTSHRAPVFYDANNTGYYVDPSSTSNIASLVVNGILTIAQPSSGRYNGIEGSYDPTRLAAIWSMGGGYRLGSDGSPGTLYGMNYSYEPNYGGTGNNSGAISGLGHQMHWRSNGGVVTALGTGIWTSGDVTAYSDIRVKTNIVKIENALEKVLSVNGYTFERTDLMRYSEDGDKPARQTGVIAQEILKILPEAVTGTEESHYSVAYGNLAGLFIEAIKEQQKQIDELKELVKQLTNK
jgi:hypothetical protein